MTSVRAAVAIPVPAAEECVTVMPVYVLNQKITDQYEVCVPSPVAFARVTGQVGYVVVSTTMARVPIMRISTGSWPALLAARSAQAQTAAGQPIVAWTSNVQGPRRGYAS